MINLMRHRLLPVLAVIVFSIAAPSIAQDRGTPSAQPAPTLERINQETQALFETVRPGLVSVQLPVPKWLSALGERDNPINKWQLDPEVREALEAQQSKGQVNAVISPRRNPPRSPTSTGG